MRVPLQAEASQQILLSSFNQLIENVEVPFPVVLVDNSGLFEQVIEDVTSHRGALPPGQKPGMERKKWGVGGGGGGEDKAGVLKYDVGFIKHAGFTRSMKNIVYPQTEIREGKVMISILFN